MHREGPSEWDEELADAAVVWTADPHVAAEHRGATCQLQ